MPYARKRGNVWRCEVEKRKVRLSQDGFSTKGAALAWGREREAEIMARVRGSIVANHTLTDALERYRDHVATDRWEILRIEFFLRHLACVGEWIDRVTSDALGRYRDARLKGELREKDGSVVPAVTGETVRREFNLLAAVFREAREEWKWCASNPVKSVTKPPKGKPRTYLITPTLEAAALAALGYTDGARPTNATQLVGAMFALAIETGMRSGEIVDLQPRHVDVHARVAHLPDSKNGDARDVPLSKRAVVILKGIGFEKTDDRVFPISDDSRDALFRKVRDRTPALKGMNFHDTRHAACTRLAKKLHVLDLARMIGHRDPKSLMVYYSASASDVALLLD